MKKMSEKKTIVHVIDDLGRGGAETLLVDLLKDLSDYYNIVLVTLSSVSDFDKNEIRCQQQYSLEYKGLRDIPVAILKLRKIIKKHNPVLVRSQLYWSTLIARMACPKKIPFVFSVHVTLSDGSFSFTKKGKLLKWLEKITYTSHQNIIGVTQEVLDDYKKAIGLKGKSYLLNNYVNDAYFTNAIEYIPPSNGHFKLVAVGNPKKQKNYELLINTFRLLNSSGISCDIYGNGGNSGYDSMLQQEIDRDKLNIFLKGKSANVYDHLKNYDAFIMPSWFEGFGIAVGEAMAVGLPVFLADIRVLREVSHNNAIFFNPADAKELADKIQSFIKGEVDAIALSQNGKEITKQFYSKKKYLTKLLAIYEDCMAKTTLVHT